MTIEPTASPLSAGLAGRCPRCGQGPLFAGFLAVRDHCPACALDYGFADAGDGPAVFITFFAGFVAVGAALWLELAYAPPYWVHALVSLPVILVTCLAPLRPLKGWLIARQYQMGATEVRGSDIDGGGGRDTGDR